MSFYDYLLNSFEDSIQNPLPKEIDNPRLDFNKEVFDFVYGAVKELSNNFPSPPINQLMKRTKELIDKGEVSVLEGPHLQSFAIGLLSIANVSNSPQRPAMVAPLKWLEENNDLNKYGGIIAVSSQIITYIDKDTFNNPHLLKEANEKCAAYEAEFLRIKLEENPELKSTLSQYQKNILQDYPQGINTESVKEYFNA